jgi:hypothetical protein
MGTHAHAHPHKTFETCEDAQLTLTSTLDGSYACHSPSPSRQLGGEDFEMNRHDIIVSKLGRCGNMEIKISPYRAD